VSFNSYMSTFTDCRRPGMGLNAYFAYQVVGFHGTGRISYGQALAAVFIEGLIFFALSLLGMRQWLVRILPTSIKVASGCGIGLFLSLIGLSYSAGIGAVTGGGTATPTDIAGCPPQYINAVTGVCDSHKMQNPQVCRKFSLEEIILTISAVDWLVPWRCSHGLFDGLQGEECNCDWYCNCFYCVLAVSSLILTSVDY
jgi:hypothetical protein